MDATNAQRALWMVLITSLAAPFFASLGYVALTLGRPWTSFALPPPGDQSLGEAAAGAFAWSGLPATIAGLALLPYVLQTGTCGWLPAAVAGVLACMVAFVIWPFSAGSAVPYLAFLAGLIGVAMRAILIRGGILKA